MENYIDRIKLLKSQKKITNEQLASLTGIPLGPLSKLLAGMSDSPKLSNIIAICGALDCSVEYVISGKPENKNNYTLNEEEIALVEDYRKLNVWGKDMVQTVMFKELQRVSEVTEAVPEKIEKVEKIEKIEKIEKTARIFLLIHATLLIDIEFHDLIRKHDGGNSRTGNASTLDLRDKTQQLDRDQRGHRNKRNQTKRVCQRISAHRLARAKRQRQKECRGHGTGRNSTGVERDTGENRRDKERHYNREQVSGDQNIPDGNAADHAEHRKSHRHRDTDRQRDTHSLTLDRTLGHIFHLLLENMNRRLSLNDIPAHKNCNGNENIA